jgi:hypothetical protein
MSSHKNQRLAKFAAACPFLWFSSLALKPIKVSKPQALSRPRTERRVMARRQACETTAPRRDRQNKSGDSA